MAALIKQDTGLDAGIEPGGRGELSVWVGDRRVANKDHKGFPSDAQLLASVNAALASP